MSLNSSGTVLYRNEKCCSEFTDCASLDLRKLCQAEKDDKTTAPTSYSHKTSISKESKSLVEIKKTDTRKPMGTDMTVITTANKSYRERKGHLLEPCPYRTRCYQCKDLVQRVRSLLDEIKAIRKNVTSVVVCDFCKCPSASAKCKRCEFLKDRYKISENIDNDARQQRFKIWLCKVKQFLYTILERETCKHKIYPKTPATDELTNLLHELKSPLTIREPEIGYFPSIDSLENITESKDILEEVLLRLKSEKRSTEFIPPISCICKYFADKKIQEVLTEEKDLSFEGAVPPPTVRDSQTVDVNAKKGAGAKSELKLGYQDKSRSKGELAEDVKLNENELKKIKEKTIKEKDKKLTSEEKLFKSKTIKEKEKKLSLEKEGKQGQPKIPKEVASKRRMSSQEAMLSKLIKQGGRDKTTKPEKAQKPPVLPKIEDLPTLTRKVKEIKELVEYRSVSESVIDCDVMEGEVTEMVKGSKIVPVEHRKDLETGSVQPMLFKVTPNFTDDTHTVSSTLISDKLKKNKNKIETEEPSGKGIIKYMLSNREFIEKGWTLLPTTKIMRRMNIYKMVPANPQFDWFDRHKTQRLLYYDSGEKLAEIEENGNGKWFYKNGSLALDYYCDQGENVSHRCVVYSSSEDSDAGKILPVTVLASFDYQGNGAVYDHYGNERLKYNQSEGILFDEKIGPPGRWKWHTLNEPPVLQPMFTDAYAKPSSCLEQFLRSRKDDDKSDAGSKYTNKKETNLDMLTIELENFLKEKEDKLLQEFKPFQIKTKALKVNDKFSLKVLDQASVYLLFREGHTSIKLNLGMLLISSEIVDTETSDMTQVATPYDRRPPRSQSIADIQKALEKARKLGKARGKLRN